MQKLPLTLIRKTQLTHDVFELVYTHEWVETIIPGQYVMFLLAPGLSRAYSIAHFSSWEITLIIKRIPDGKGSPIICDAEVGSTFDGMLPLGRFHLQDTQANTCFIGTGTGFAPLWCMMRQSITNYELRITNWNTHDSGITKDESIQSRKQDQRTALIFWVRNFEDTFYQTEIEHLRDQYPQFSTHFYLSCADHEGYERGYVTDWITDEHIRDFEEFYLCGSKPMIDESTAKLLALGVSRDQIFHEAY